MVGVRLGHLCLTGSCWEHPQPDHGTVCPSSYPCGSKSSPKRKQGAGRDISNLASKLALRTSLLQALGPVLDGISVSEALERLFLLAQSQVLLPLSPGSSQGWSCYVGHDALLASETCRALAGHAVALLMTQSHIQCLAAEWEPQEPFPG